MPKAPIAILSFNRPDYLKETLESLAAQANDELIEREIHLFQDGGINQISGKEYASNDIIDKNIAIFTSLFPHGTVHKQSENLGIARHFDFIERYFFETRSFEIAIFFEDDMVLSPHYLTIMERLIPEALRNDKIGYVAAYGNHYAPLTDQLKNFEKITTMIHKWGFALTRKQWLRQRPYVDEYLDFISNMDYNIRNHDLIYKFFLKRGILPDGTSQDGAKDAFMYLSGATKLMTYCCYAKYLGKVGIHFNEELYTKAKFDKTEICQKVTDTFHWPSENELDQIINQERIRLKNAAFEKVMRDYMPITRDDVFFCYRHFLKRAPESEEAITHHMHHSPSLNVLRENFLNSAEYKKNLEKKPF